MFASRAASGLNPSAYRRRPTTVNPSKFQSYADTIPRRNRICVTDSKPWPIVAAKCPGERLAVDARVVGEVADERQNERSGGQRADERVDLPHDDHEPADDPDYERHADTEEHHLRPLQVALHEVRRRNSTPTWCRRTTGRRSVRTTERQEACARHGSRFSPGVSSGSCCRWSSTSARRR